jgi:hypothetical protein
VTPDGGEATAPSLRRRPEWLAAVIGRSSRALSVRSLVLTALAALVVVFYFWTAYSGGAGAGYYGALTDAFLEGQTFLITPPPSELLALSDPYDPEQNEPYRLHDASLYQDRWYLYFGPTPVLLVFMPLRSVGVHATDELALALLSSAGFLLSLALMGFLVRRYRPTTSTVTRAFAVLVLGVATVAPYNLRRPAAYEVAIAAGYCCLLAAIYLTLTGALRPRPSLARLAGGSLFLGLAAGARPHLALALPIFVWAWLRAARSLGGRAAPRPQLLRLASAALAPFLACLVLLAVYNVVRFGSVSEFGQTYQLGGIKTSTLDHFDLSRLVPGLFFYLLSPPSFDFAFPFIHLDPSYPGTLSAQYEAGIEPVAGALATTPILVLAIAAPVLLYRNQRGRREDMLVASLFLLVALLVMAVPLLSFNGATMRYELDWLPIMALAALLVWLRGLDALATRPRPLLIGAGTIAGAAVCFAVISGLAFSVTGCCDTLRNANPATYERVRSAFDWVPGLAARIRREPFVVEVGPLRPTAVTAIEVAAPSGGVVDLRGDFITSPKLPRRSIVSLRVQGTDGVVRRYPLRQRTTRVRAGLRGSGVQAVLVHWDVLRYGRPGTPPPTGSVEAGFAIADTRVVAWSAQ